MAQHIITKGNVFDVFQAGLKRGVEVLPYSPRKKYFYVEHPEERMEGLLARRMLCP